MHMMMRQIFKYKLIIIASLKIKIARAKKFIEVTAATETASNQKTNTFR